MYIDICKYEHMSYHMHNYKYTLLKPLRCLFYNITHKHLGLVLEYTCLASNYFAVAESMQVEKPSVKPQPTHSLRAPLHIYRYVCVAMCTYTYIYI